MLTEVRAGAETVTGNGDGAEGRARRRIGTETATETGTETGTEIDPGTATGTEDGRDHVHDLPRNQKSEWRKTTPNLRLCTTESSQEWALTPSG